MADQTKRGIAMIAAVSEALKVRAQTGDDSEETIMKGAMHFIKKAEFKEYKVEMIAAVSYATKIMQREPKLKDRQIIDRVMNEMSTIVPVE